MNPEEAIPDEFGHVSAVRFREQINENGKWRDGDAVVTLPARSVFVAAGTTPNVTYEREYPGTFQMDERRRFFKPHVAERAGDGAITLVPASEGFFTSYHRDGRYVTYYGDNHPKYAGNVVKAMASARDGYPHVVAAVPRGREGRAGERVGGPHGGMAAVHGRPRRRLPRPRRARDPADADDRRGDREGAGRRAGTSSPGSSTGCRTSRRRRRVLGAGENGPRMLMEGLALTGAWVDKEQGLLSMIALEMGVSSRQCAYLKPGEPVVVMGPTGAPTEIPHGENVLLAGGGLGNAVLFSIAKALRASGNRVLYFAGYKNGADLFKREEVEAATDQVIWTTDTGVEIPPSRPQDAHFRGNIVQAMIAYAKGELGEALVPLKTVDRIIAIGSDRMMAAIKLARLRRSSRISRKTTWRSRASTRRCSA